MIDEESRAARKNSKSKHKFNLENKSKCNQFEKFGKA